MITVTLNGRPISAEKGTRISDLIGTESGIETPCGGKGRCGKCRVQASGILSPVSDAEEQFLSEEERKNGIRLACCCTAEGDCCIRTFREGKAYVLEVISYSNTTS